MKKVFCVLAVAALFLVGITSCTQPKTATELLTQKNGWVLSSATSAPAYHLSDGSFATDLMTEGYLMSWELDDIIVFNENGSHLLKPGKNVPESAADGFVAETSLGNWAFDNAENPEFIFMQVPFLYDYDAEGNFTFDAAVEKCQVLALTENELRIKCTIDDTENPAKEVYSFTLTYVPAK